MSNNYKDICEFGEQNTGAGADSTGTLGSDFSVPSLPPFLENQVDILDSSMASPFSDLSENLTSPELEITSGRIDRASRMVTMIPQEFVYNFT